jgi:hypothetical protein
MNSELVAFGTKSRKRAAAANARRRYPARIARQLALAHALQRRVEAGEFADYADMARALGFTRARITQIMDLLLLAADIQEEILHLEVAPLGMWRCPSSSPTRRLGGMKQRRSRTRMSWRPRSTRRTALAGA